jgi:hypothetical protein
MAIESKRDRTCLPSVQQTAAKKKLKTANAAKKKHDHPTLICGIKKSFFYPNCFLAFTPFAH